MATPVLDKALPTITIKAGDPVDIAPIFPHGNDAVGNDNEYTPPLTWSISPALPPGLTLNTSTGHITGRATSTDAATVYTLTVTDSYVAPPPSGGGGGGGGGPEILPV